MTLNDLITIFRRDADDEALPQLWSDAEVTEFANDAVMEAARRARLILDSRTPEVCIAAVAENDPWVPIDPRIIFVRRAILAGRTIALCKTEQREMDHSVPGWESSIATTPTHFLQDASANVLRIWPPSSVSTNLNLTVIREPLAPLEAGDDEPEIPARYHRSLVFWMLYRAFSKPDSDATDEKRAALAEAQFEREFGKRSSALEEEWARIRYGSDTYEGQF